MQCPTCTSEIVGKPEIDGLREVFVCTACGECVSRPARPWRDAAREKKVEVAMAHLQTLFGWRPPESLCGLLVEERTARGARRAVSIEGPVPDALRAYLDDDSVDVGCIFDDSFATTVLESRALTREWSLPSELILLGGDGHTWIALDPRTGEADPPVVLVETDSGTSAVIAGSFGRLLHAIQPGRNSDET